LRLGSIHQLIEILGTWRYVFLAQKEHFVFSNHVCLCFFSSLGV
jgi:hypothetical protein